MNVQTISIPFDEELLPSRRVNTGKLDCLYENGRLRYLKYGGTEVIRMIYFALRDEDWKTVSYTISNQNIETSENGFSISFNALHQLNDISYSTEIIIQAVDTAITFYMKGKALSSFKRNRIGICVLHPVEECRGKKVIVTKPDGTDYTASFPDLVSPHQPFREIKKMLYELNDGIRVELNFEGDEFETEDQRNWSDSSYKTYSTPLNIPFPVQVNKGDTIEQKIGLSITGKNRDKKAVAISEEERKIPFPKIGYASADKEQLTADEIHLLRQIPFDHYRVEISFLNETWKEKLNQSFAEARELSTRLELVLIFDDAFKNQLEALLAAFEENSSLINSALILHVNHPITPADLLEISYKEIKSNYPLIKVGYGTNGFFSNLNRNRPIIDNFDFVSFSLTPQVHADDSRTLVENLGQQADIIHTARSFASGKEIYVSPITLKIRASPGEKKKTPPDADPRQYRSIGALWTLSSVKNLGAADRLTFYQVKGYRGILNKVEQPPEHSNLFGVLKTIKKLNPKWIVQNDRQQKFLPDKIVLENDQGDRLEFIVNAGVDLEDSGCERDS
ncbi:MAG: hypothetical protein H7122_17220 [Chitinophagaceae bacterium]|nr:hypothetical protein [Chitinophagaceae bacterium]